MKNARSLILLLAVVILAIFGYYFFANQDMNVNELPEIVGEPIRMNYNDWPPDLITYLAQEMGYFREEGVNVELVLVEDFDDLIEKRDSGLLDIFTFTLLDIVADKASGAAPDAEVFLLEDYSDGADAILTAGNSEIETVDDLKGKKIAVDEGTISEFFLNTVLVNNGLSLDDVTKVNAAFDEIPELLESGEIDAGVAYEPVITQVVTNGGKVLIDSSEQRNSIVDVYVANKQLLETRKDDVVKVARAIHKAADFFRDNPEEAIEIMRKPVGYESEELLDSFAKLRIPDLRDNQNAFDRTSAFASLYNLVRLAQQYLEGQGAEDIDFDPDTLVNSTIVDQL